jgi:hypothetical protein
MEQDVRVAGDTVNIETGQLLIKKRFLCTVAFCKYKCLNIVTLQNSTVCIHSYVRKVISSLSLFCNIKWLSSCRMELPH